MNNLFRAAFFVILILFHIACNASFGQIRQIDKGITEEDSLRKFLLKGFNLQREIKLEEYDTVVVLNKNLLALGKGITERYREYIILDRLGNILQRKISFLDGFQFKEGCIPIVTRSGEGFLLESGRVPFFCNLSGSYSFEGGLAYILAHSIPGIDYTKSGRETPYNAKGQQNPFHVLGNYVNRKFELMIPKYYDSIEPYREGKIRMVMKKGLFGFLDTTGQEVIKPILNDFDADNQYRWQHLRRVEQNGRFGFIDDRNGQQIIPFQYEATVASTFPFTWVRKSGKWGCINQHNIVLLPFVYNVVSYFDADSISIAGRDGRMGHIRADGRIVTPLAYESVHPFSEKLSLVEQDGRFGYVNQAGQLIIPAVYDKATSFRHGRASAERFGLKIILNKAGKWVDYKLGTGWNLSIVLLFLLLVLFVGYRRIGV
ncbi:WG repeat-containing protein [Spirosoma terrae]|uniref:WG repeat-containing protein n=1 Tax=Spirosoma terrae TaxID=1968276 RepID=A0A6L9LDV8_9BACT|nr:WG repeat-containing protein [Spirosoma terrae]NDU96993.1 WG repeat-containing protein [Spirosoma terrae]